MTPEAARYFEKIAGSPNRFHTVECGVVDLRELTFKQAEKLWKAGFKYIKLTRKGEKKYMIKDRFVNIPEDLKKIILDDDIAKSSIPGEPEKPPTAREIVGMIKSAENKAQVEAFQKLNPESIMVEKAAIEKLMKLEKT